MTIAFSDPAQTTTETATEDSVLVVVPCLNEEKYLPDLLPWLIADCAGLDALIVVADGGSTDRSREIVTEFASRYSQVRLIDNQLRIQSAAVNRAVETFGRDRTWLVRIDAHSGYPDGFVPRLLTAAKTTGAASVVVPMNTVGLQGFQKSAAAAQNSVLGNGGSAHRSKSSSRFVDHGHHALMRISAYREVGGYDEKFSHNEDAELDTRLRTKDYRIWLEQSLAITYYPRSSPWPLFQQYFNYGKGRARNIRKHGTIPKVRQMVPLAVGPSLVLALLSPFFWPLALPFIAWGLGCLVYGLTIGYKSGSMDEALSGFAAMLMHMGWSLGFFAGLLEKR